MDQNPYNPYQPDQQSDPSNQGQPAPYGGEPTEPHVDPYQKPPVPPVVDPYQPYNYQPGVPPVQKGVPPTNGLAIASLVLGIVSVVCCSIFMGFLGIPGLICAIIAMAKGNRSGMAIAGLILSIVGFLLFVVLIAVMVAYPNIVEDIMNDNFYYYYRYGY